MKQFYTFLAAVLLTATTFAQVGINTETPDPSAALDITSTTGGVLMPRMTAAQRDAITATQGLIIFCTDCAFGEGELQVKLTSTWISLHDGGEINDPVTLAIGDTHQGGVVFHLFVDGETGYVAGETHGLIAAVEDQSSGIRWYNGYNVTTGATATAIGTGSANTDAIISVQGATTISYAAGLARAYAGGGYTDWFLPSTDELSQMYYNKTTLEGVSGFTAFSNYYWSSTELSITYTWGQHFTNGAQFGGDKDFLLYLRAVRAF